MRYQKINCSTPPSNPVSVSRPRENNNCLDSRPQNCHCLLIAEPFLTLSWLQLSLHENKSRGSTLVSRRTFKRVTTPRLFFYHYSARLHTISTSRTMSVLPPQVHAELTELLQALQSSDNTVRSQAEDHLTTNWTSTKPEMLLMGLVEQIYGSNDTTVS
jgi:hypothetical protein